MDDRASKGGKARAESLTPEQRSESARRAVQARWRKAQQVTITTTFSPPVEKVEVTTHEIRKVIATPSLTTQVTTAWSASSHSSVTMRNKKVESSTQ